MLVGVDFDNTIVCYDQVVHRSAVEQGLIPESVTATKGHVRDYLRECGQEEAWIELQGHLYGKAIEDASAFEGATDFFMKCREEGIAVRIISHKTLRPFRGHPYDLHQAARDWLEHRGFFRPDLIGLSRDQVFLEHTKQEKLQRIGRLGCTHFIDDLPEFLAEPDFPEGVRRVLFDPDGKHEPAPSVIAAHSWGEVQNFILSEGGR